MNDDDIGELEHDKHMKLGARPKLKFKSAHVKSAHVTIEHDGAVEKDSVRHENTSPRFDGLCLSKIEGEMKLEAENPPTAPDIETLPQKSLFLIRI